jgi:hypothetical protein
MGAHFLNGCHKKNVSARLLTTHTPGPIIKEFKGEAGPLFLAVGAKGAMRCRVASRNPQAETSLKISSEFGLATEM